MATFGTVPDVKLQDVWPPYKAALDKFEAEPTGENWEAVLCSAAEFRAKVKRLRESVDA